MSKYRWKMGYIIYTIGFQELPTARMNHISYLISTFIHVFDLFLSYLFTGLIINGLVYFVLVFEKLRFPLDPVACRRNMRAPMLRAHLITISAKLIQNCVNNFFGHWSDFARHCVVLLPYTRKGRRQLIFFINLWPTKVRMLQNETALVRLSNNLVDHSHETF